MGDDAVTNGQKTSASHVAFRVVLGSIGVLTVLGTSHAVRYVLCGVLVATFHKERSGGQE